MSRAAAKNEFRNGVLVGNWNEDRWGADLAHRVAASNPSLETTSYRATYNVDPTPMRDPSRPALPGFDTLDGHLMMAHAPSAEGIAARRDAADHYLTMSEASLRGTPSSVVIAGKVDAPSELDRKSLIHDKARSHAVGLDSWDTDRRVVPRVPMTVTPNYGLAETIRAAPAVAPPSRHFVTAKEKEFATSAVLAETTAGVRESGHGRNFGFTAEFKRGVAGLRT